MVHCASKHVEVVVLNMPVFLVVAYVIFRVEVVACAEGKKVNIRCPIEKEVLHSQPCC